MQSVDPEPGPQAKSTGGLVRLSLMRKYSEKPAVMYAAACGTHCCFFLLFIILSAAVGKDFLNQTTDVALHLWENDWKVRFDALIEGNAVCTYDLSTDTEQKQQEMARLPVGHQEYNLEIVYNSNDGNMLTVEKLLKVKDLEDSIVNHPEYKSFCIRESGTTDCQSPRTVVQACAPALCGAVQNEAGPQPPTPQVGCGSANAQGLTPATDCSPVKSVPAGAFQCTNPAGCSRDQWSIDQSFLDTKLKGYATADFAFDFPETAFMASVDATFGAGDTTGSALYSRFSFGFPLQGYQSTEDKPEEQMDKIHKWMGDTFFDTLEQYNSKHGDESGFKIGYTGGNLMDMSVNALLRGDFALVAMAFLVVFVYVMAMTGSIFLSAMAMVQIFLSFASGFIVYRIVFGSFFGTFHIMAIFLLLGVGVDDVFVFNDHFEAALQMDPGYTNDLWARMSWTWKHAAVAMGVTSLTTSVSFFLNASSSFPGIAAFGVFAGCLIVILYISMLFYWPAVIAFNQSKFKQKPFLCGLLQACKKGHADDLPQTAKDEAPKPALVRFFEHHFSYFILNYRIRILLVFVAVSVFMFLKVAELAPAKEQPSMLPDDHPISQYREVMSNKFVRGGGQFNTVVDLVFGFDKEPLDREGVDISGAGENLGTVRWNPNWVNSSGLPNAPVILAGFDCFIQLCDAAEIKDEKRKTGGAPAYSMAGCFPRDVRDHLKTAHPSDWESRWQKITQGDRAEWNAALRAKVAADSSWYQSLETTTYLEKVGDIVFYRYFVASLRLTSSLNMEYSDGNALAERWEAWLAEQMSIGSCASTAGTFWPFVGSGHFHQFKVTETLISEMVTGVCISISVALVVLVLVTGNIIIGVCAAFTIGMIVVWVMAMIPILGWDLGIVENIILVMVPGLSVDFTAHLAESYNQAKYDNREHRVVHALEHSGVSIISGSASTSLAGICLIMCKITFFVRFGTLLLCTIASAVLFSLFFFPSLMALIGPVGLVGDWHRYIHPCMSREVEHQKDLRLDPVRVSAKDPPAAKIGSPGPSP